MKNTEPTKNKMGGNQFKSFPLAFDEKVPPAAIPHICLFFTQAKFLENKIYTEKRQFFALNL